MLAVLSVTIFSRLLGQLGVAVASRLAEHAVELRGLVLRAFALACVLGPVGTVLIFAWGWLTDDVGAGIALLAGLALTPNVIWQTVSGVLLGVARVRLWNYVQALTPLATLVGMLVLVVALGGGVRAALLAWLLANVLTASFALVAARGLWTPLALPRLADRHGRAILRLALVMGAVQVVSLVSYRVELYILNRYEGLSEVGVYSIAVQAGEALWLIAAAVATAVTAPAVHETEARAARLIARAAARGLALTTAAAVALGLVAPFAIPLIFGEDFAGASVPLALLLPGVVVYAPVSILVVYLSVRRGRPRLSLAVSVLGLVVTTALALVLIPRHGGAGAAVASTIGYAAGAALALLFFVRLARATPSTAQPAS